MKITHNQILVIVLILILLGVGLLNVWRYSVVSRVVRS